MKKISLLIPAYNEEKTLSSLYQELLKLIDLEPGYEWEMLFIDDGSKDNTLNILKQLRAQDNRVNYVELSRNFGKENAMLAGFDYVTGDACVIMDADLQDPPSLIHQMLRFWEEGYEDVYAKRQDRGEESFLRRNLSLLFYKILQSSTRFEILENVGDFRLLDRCCITVLRKLRETERYTKGIYCWIGFKKKEVLFDRGNRIAGQSNWNFISLFNLAIEGITSFTTTPLRIASILGFLISIWAICYMIWIFSKTLIWGDPVAGYPTMMIVILFLGGSQLLGIGIIGEYLARIFKETKNRPTYIAREYNGKRCD